MLTCSFRFVLRFLARYCSAARHVARRQGYVVVRAFASEGKDKQDIPVFGLGKWFGLESDKLIPTDKDRSTKQKHIPDFVPDDVKKEMKDMGLEGIEDLDEMEARNTDGYNDLGLVPPEGTGTFASPILIPSRRGSRVVGYEDPDSHAMFWFTIHNDNNTYYIKDLGLFFKCLHIPSEGGGHH